MELRLARNEDAEAIRAIYNNEVSSGTATFDLSPRTLDEQREWMTERSGAHVVLVAETNGEVKDGEEGEETSSDKKEVTQ